MIGSIIDIAAAGRRELDTEILVIGSGAGGATAARVLAEAGREVTVIEEGRDLTGPALTQRDGPMYDQLYMDRGGRMTSDHGVHVLQARVLGGGPVINAGDVVPISDEVLEHWVTAHGLSTFTPENLEPYRQKALEDLAASKIPDENVNLANAKLRQGAEAIGARGVAMTHNRVGCAGLGTCLIGCPLGAKQGPRQVSIPIAVERGARFYTRARAVRIDDLARPTKSVVVRSLDPLGYRETGELLIRAQTVIVAANAVATPELLLRSGAPNPWIGRGLMLQPQLPIVAIFDEPIDAFRGIPQSYAITEYEQLDAASGLGGFRIEGIMGTPGIVASLLPFIGQRGREMMSRYRHLAASLLLVPDSPSGSVRVERDRLRIDYAESDDHKARARRAARVAARAYLAAGATKVIVPVVPAIEISSERDLRAIDAMQLRPASAPLLSAHQQGTVKMGPSPEKAAANPAGLVYGTDRVYVVDSSLFPTSASSHTMAPIITVARMLADRIAASP